MGALPAATALLVVCGPWTPEAEAFREAAQLAGVQWENDAPPPPGLPVVVIITSKEADAPAGEILAGRDVLPVSLVDGYAPLFPGLSHLSPRTLGSELATARLVDAVVNGSTALVSWERLVDEAKDWEASGSRSQLLSESAKPAALASLASPRAQVSPDADLVRRFISTSGQRTKVLRRRGNVALIALGALLTAAIIVATAQTISAKVGSDRSLAAADASEARRLSDLALQYLGRDPDVPLMLAATANSLADTVAVRQAVGQVAATQVSHLSFDLDGIPYAVESSESGLLLVTQFEDPLISVFSPEGVLVSAFPYLDEGEEFRAASTALSPDGTQVAVDDGQLRVFDLTGKSHLVAGSRSDDGLQQWWDDQHVLINGDGGVFVVEVETGERELLAGEGLARVRVSKPSADGSKLAVSDAERVQVWDLEHSTLLHDAAVPGVTDLAVSDDGNFIIGAAFPHAKILTFDGDELSTATADDDWATIGVEVISNGYFAASDRVGSIALYSRDNTGSGPVARFQAHLSDNVRIAALPNGDFASVGFDGMLRVWATSDLQLLGTPTPAGVVTPQSAIATEAGGDNALESFPAATLRNQVRAVSDDSVGVVLTHTSTAGIIDPAHPEEATGGMFGGIFNRVFLSDDGRFVIVAVGGADAAIEIWPLNADGDDWRQMSLSIPVDFPPGPTGSLIGPVLPSVAPGGDVIAVATSTALSTWNGDGTPLETSVFSASADPLSIDVSDEGIARTITSDGTLHSTTAPDIDLLSLLPSESGAISAAEFWGTDVLLLTESGSVMRFSEGNVIEVVPAGTLSGVGTLRISDDGALIACVAPDSVTIMNSNGGVIARQPTIAGIFVEDVDFSPDGSQLISLSSIGTVNEVDISSLGIAPLVDRPRSFSQSELLAFELGEVDG